MSINMHLSPRLARNRRQPASSADAGRPASQAALLEPATVRPCRRPA